MIVGCKGRVDARDHPARASLARTVVHERKPPQLCRHLACERILIQPVVCGVWCGVCGVGCGVCGVGCRIAGVAHRHSLVMRGGEGGGGGIACAGGEETEGSGWRGLRSNSVGATIEWCYGEVRKTGDGLGMRNTE